MDKHFEGKVICKECKSYHGNNSPRGITIASCSANPEVRLDFVHKKVIKLPWHSCHDSNKDGKCESYMPIDFEKRLNLLLERGRKNLEEDLSEIIDDMRYDYYDDLLTNNPIYYRYFDKHGSMSYPIARALGITIK